MQERYLLTFDEFFKLGSRRFFTQLGMQVETEVPIFKQPKRLDVLVVKKPGALPKDFKIFRYFQEHNLISFKSVGDRVRAKDIYDATVYLNGYVGMVPKAGYENTSMTVVANHTPRGFLQKYKDHWREVSAGHFELDFGPFKVHLLNLNDLPLEGFDARFLCHFASTEKLKEFLSIYGKSKKIVVRLKEFLYLRLKSFEDKYLQEQYMPKILQADITHLVGPMMQRADSRGHRRGLNEGLQKGLQKGLNEGLQKGEQKKQILIAQKMAAEGFSSSQISRLTGLSQVALKKLVFVPVSPRRKNQDVLSAAR